MHLTFLPLSVSSPASCPSSQACRYLTCNNLPGLPQGMSGGQGEGQQLALRTHEVGLQENTEVQNKGSLCITLVN